VIDTVMKGIETQISKPSW